MRDRAALLGEEPDETATEEPVRAEAAVLKVNQQSARVQIFGEEGQVTFRSGDIWGLALTTNKASPTTTGATSTLSTTR